MLPTDPVVWRLALSVAIPDWRLAPYPLSDSHCPSRAAEVLARRAREWGETSRLQLNSVTRLLAACLMAMCVATIPSAQPQQRSPGAAPAQTNPPRAGA